MGFHRSTVVVTGWRVATLGGWPRSSVPPDCCRIVPDLRGGVMVAAFRARVYQAIALLVVGKTLHVHDDF